MAGRQDIKAGRAYIELFIKNSSLTKGLKAVKQNFADLSGWLTNVGGSLFRTGSMIAGTFGGIAAALAFPIKAAGDLMETTSKFESVFGDSSAAVKQWADDYANAVGRSKSETMTALSTFQAFFSGLGVGADQAADFSKELTSLSVDFASFHNLQDPEAMQRFISALSGSGEVLSMFGVNIMQAALDQKLLQLGFKKSTQGATEMQKVMARMVIIKESMGKQGAVGDALKTAGSFSNQLKALKGSVLDTAEAIGGALLPVVTPLVAQARSVAKAVAEWAKNNGQMIVTVAKWVVGLTAAGGALAGIGALLMALGGALSLMGPAFGVILTAVGALVSPLGLALVAIGGIAIALARSKVAGEHFGKVLHWVGEQFGWLKEMATAWLEPMVADFKTTWSGITDAIAAGDLSAAAEVAWAGMQIVWQRGVNGVNKLWLDAKWYFVQIWTEAQHAVSKGFVSMWSGVERAAQKVGDTVRTSWSDYKKASVNVLADMYESSAEQGWRSKEERQKFREMAAAMRQDSEFIHKQEKDDIEERRKLRLKEIDDQERGALSVLEQDKARAEKNRLGQYDKDIATKERELSAARSGLESARNRAAKSLEAARLKTSAPGGAPTAPVMPSMPAMNLPAMRDTFVTSSASALTNLGGGGGAQSAVQVAKEQLKLQREAQAILQGIIKENRNVDASAKLMLNGILKHIGVTEATNKISENLLREQKATKLQWTA